MCKLITKPLFVLAASVTINIKVFQYFFNLLSSFHSLFRSELDMNCDILMRFTSMIDIIVNKKKVFSSGSRLLSLYIKSFLQKTG